MKKEISNKKPNRLRLARQLMRTKNLVVITDDEVSVSVKLADDMTSIVQYTNVRASLERLHKMLTETMKSMDKDMDKVLREPPTSKRTKRKKGKV